MRKIRKMYIVLGLGIGITLSGIIGLISSLLITQQNLNFKQVEKESLKEDLEENLDFSDDKSEDQVEYKTNKYSQDDEIESEQIEDIINEDIDLENHNMDDDIKSITIVIPKTYGATEISRLLNENGIVDDSNEFLMLIRENNKQTKLQDGTITIPINASNEQILDILTVTN